MSDRVISVKAKLEDLLFRAQRIATAAKNNVPSNDLMYGYDLQGFRKNLRAFSSDMSALPTLLGSLERQAAYDQGALKLAQSVMRLTARLLQSLNALHETALLAHQHIRLSNHKMEAWYIAQEVEEFVQKAQSMPTTANKIVIATSTPPTDGPRAALG
ncbi:MAG: hypothetical protein HYZ74_08850 [Elusimicrobia bacterium]|nr:hypothetical protein [Elusimicrobiota bacterium]